MAAVASLGLATASFAQNVPSYVPSNGLVGWWPFNGNADDVSGNGNHGSVNGATLTKDRFGNSGKSYEFSGDDQILIEPWNQITGKKPFSLNFWVLPSDNYKGWIISFGNSKNGEGFECGNWNWGGGNVFGAQIWSFNFFPNYFTTLKPLEWSNITIIYDGSNLICYKNGLYVSQHVVNYTNVNLVSGQFSIGKQINYEEYFKGQLDDIGIWNRALTQQEITNLYNSNICYQTVTVTDTLVINLGITGYNPVTYSNSIKIYPNPTNDHITIDYGHFTALNGHQIVIKNSMGQEMFQSAITQQSSYINLGSWSGKGLYFVHILDPKGNTLDIRKIVLQ